MFKKLIRASKRNAELENLTRLPVEQLSRDEAQDVLKWQRRKRKNNELLLLALALGATVKAKNELNKIEMERKLG